MSTTAQPKPSNAPTQTKPSATTFPAATAATAAKARSGRKPVDPNETPEKTFKRLCQPRVTKMLKQAKAIRNLSRFKPEEKYREKVFAAIREAVNLAETAWKGNESIEEGFQL